MRKKDVILIYEGHDTPKFDNNVNPKLIDQPMTNRTGTFTQNGLFYQAAIKYKNRKAQAEIIKVYEKVKAGIWVYGGLFKLVDAWQEVSGSRKVFKFKLELTSITEGMTTEKVDMEHNRLIPSSVKIEVWRRDKGKCVKCGSTNNLHFDHIIPYSKGGSSLIAGNIQLLCARHNIAKRDSIF